MPVDDQPPAPSISVPPTRAVAQGHPAVFDSAPQKPAVPPSPDAFIPVRDESPPPPIPDPPNPEKPPADPFGPQEEEEPKGKDVSPGFFSQPILDDNELPNDDFFSAVAPPPERIRVINIAPSPARPSAEPKAAAEKKISPKRPIHKKESPDPFGDLDEDLDISWGEVESPPKAKPTDTKPTPKNIAKPTKLQVNKKKVDEPNSADTFQIDESQIRFDFGGASTRFLNPICK
jgi:hypothetical protein